MPVNLAFTGCSIKTSTNMANNVPAAINLSEVSLSEINLSWLLVTAAIALIISLVEAWIATFIVYGKVAILKKCFPAPHNLIRSHVDYTIMAALTGFTYFALIHLSIDLPKSIIVLLCAGTIYNPLGFLVKAVKPDAGHSDSFIGKIAVYAGFLPSTIGFGYSMIAIIVALV
ncbi:MAG: hypothetical protein CSB48_09610 [Proteobacteria bacterium]|nr:MAG: hypothetical protein CSB48_09610 [Pseudomonadota bacterium]PIE40476.1 MAG: hypothetical protein CSA51_00570 [Gammaproteobacteria bacterium]